LAFVDADVVLAREFAAWALARLDDRLMLRCQSNGGLLVCSPAAFVRSGGYDEAFVGWAPEDYDLCRRLFDLGLKQVSIPSELVRVIYHGDEDRVQNYPVKDRWQSNWLNCLRGPSRIPWELMHPWQDPVTFRLIGPGFGDVWRTVEYIHHIRRGHPGTIRLYGLWHGWSDRNYSAVPVADRSGLVLEIAAALDVPRTFEVVSTVAADEVQTIEDGWHSPIAPVPTRVRWQGWGREPFWRIAYQFDGNVLGSQKNPPPNELERLLSIAPGYEMVRLGAHLSVQECVEVAARSDLFIGVDSGMIQLCYSVGVPVMIVRYSQSPWVLFDRHGRRQAIHCDNTEELATKARQFLGLAAPP
jgi:hypothetical protein